MMLLLFAHRQLGPGELLFAHLDDIHVVCLPNRVGVIFTTEQAFELKFVISWRGSTTCFGAASCVERWR